MNVVFTVIILFSTLLLLITDPTLVLPALGDSSVRAVELTLKMAAVYAVWMGLLHLCEVTGLSDRLARLLRPLIRFLYGEIPDEAARALSVNMAANVLGMGNAATPAAMRAVRAMDAGRRTASYAMIMLVVLNATSLQLLPTTIIQLRQSFQSASASDIILPSLIASTASTLFGAALVFLLYRRESRKPMSRKKPAKPNRKMIIEQTDTTVSAEKGCAGGPPSTGSSLRPSPATPPRSGQIPQPENFRTEKLHSREAGQPVPENRAEKLRSKKAGQPVLPAAQKPGQTFPPYDTRKKAPDPAANRGQTLSFSPHGNGKER